MKDKALKVAVDRFQSFFPEGTPLEDVKHFCGMCWGDYSVKIGGYHNGKSVGYEKTIVEGPGSETFVFKTDLVYGLAFGFEQKEMEL